MGSRGLLDVFNNLGNKDNYQLGAKGVHAVY
jgi:hypothetical protein